MTKRSDFQLPVRTSIDADAQVIAWDPTDTNGEPFVVPANVLSVAALTVDANLLTRTAGVPAEITRANLAADAAFVNRFATDVLWIPGSAFTVGFGAASMGTLGAGGGIDRRQTALMMADGDNVVGAVSMIPANWATFSAFLWWSNAGVGSGDVRWTTYVLPMVDADTSNAILGGGTTSQTVSAPSQYVVKRTSIHTSITAAAGSMVRCNIYRNGTNAADTVTNDVGLLGVEVRRVT